MNLTEEQKRLLALIVRQCTTGNFRRFEAIKRHDEPTYDLVLGDRGFAGAHQDDLERLRGEGFLEFGVVNNGSSNTLISELTQNGLDTIRWDKNFGPQWMMDEGIQQQSIQSLPSSALPSSEPLPPKLSRLSNIAPQLPRQEKRHYTWKEVAEGARPEIDRRKNTKKEVVFIGHGRASEWRVLRDYLKDDLGITCIEFNSDDVVGLATKERLEQLLAEATFAFLVMTAEDEHTDGKHHARANVIHEAGLFQGKLGFNKAILLVEEGCAEFSNIHGLTRISFRRGDIEGAFHKVRKKLVAEKILPN